MHPIIKLFLVMPAVTLLLMTNPTYSAIYTWEDENGVIAFSDDPTRAPSDAQVKVWSRRSRIQTVSETDLTEMATAQTHEEPQFFVMQGEFAVQLARELGLGEKPTPEEAADILTGVRIAPPLGQWELNEAMTPELTTRLRTLTVAAAQMGWITIEPEQALLGFDTAAALLGVEIPIVTGKQAPEPSQPIVEVPPLVYVSPPPQSIFPFYTWVPVTGGFLWQGASLGGFFVLHDVHLNLHFFNEHRFVFDPHIIQRHFVNHFADRHVQHVHHVVDHRIEHHVANHQAERHFVDGQAIHGRGGKRGRHFAAASPPTAPGILHRRKGSQHRLHSKQSHPSGTPSQSHSITHREPGVRHTIRHLAPPSTSIPLRSTVRPMPRTDPTHHITAPPPTHSRVHLSRDSHHASPSGHRSQKRGRQGRSFSRGGGGGHPGGH